ncbi:MAG: hypothetical protein Q9162_004477 [Coniocarpon cinnabarinum]
MVSKPQVSDLKLGPVSNTSEQGRKGKKKVFQAPEAPGKIGRATSIHNEPIPPEIPPPPPADPQPPLIDVESEAMQPEPEPMEENFDLPPQLSPPPSPMPEDLPSPSLIEQEPPPIPPSRPALPPPRRTESFTHIESPPISPLLNPQPAPPRKVSHNHHHNTQRVSSAIRPPRSGFEAYGINPHIIACISCNDFCVITGPRGIVSKSALGLEESNSDTFFTTLCAACENHRAFLWLRLEGGMSPPHPRLQHPETLHSSMLASWPLYLAVKGRFGVEFEKDARGSTAVVTRARDWWREGVLTHEKSLVLMWRFDIKRGEVRERVPMPRKDEFFGGPQR